MKLFIAFAALIHTTASAAAMGGTLAREADAAARGAVLVLSDRGSACSGTALTRTIVITAAHCAERAQNYAVSYYEGGAPKLIRASGVIRHPQAKTGSAVSVDLALVKLAEPLPARFSAAALDDSGLQPGGRARIGGYGPVNGGDDASAGKFREAELHVLPPALPRFMRIGAAGGSLSEFRICSGDSGGGVFSASGLLTGVTAQRERLGGAKECGPAAQAVRIAPQIEWIRGAMERMR